ncbi:hypothetical protein WA026_017765 [Henosepilachna vigintioctopunctata]|uniref:Peptidase A2 domain-containing protein n=1 Tax=Henosepilachna vigintioctopunctata TaxID=420089 RepID=A0AAW1U367_9CUCU
MESNTEAIKVNIQINNIPFIFILDTGASNSVISEYFYKINLANIEIVKTNKIFKLYNGDSILPLGYIDCLMSFNNSCKKFRIFVIRQAYGPPLLGRDFFTQFNLNISELNSISLNKVQYLINKFGTVFDDTLGTFNKGYISIKLKSEKMEPKFFRPRPLPFAMKEKVELELNRLLKLGVIEPVNYSPWGTPIVPVLKKTTPYEFVETLKLH